MYKARTRIKICGFTRPEDAVFAAYAGVDAIGLVFYPASPRHVDIAKAQAIVKALPAFVSVVALFVDETAENIRQVLEQVPIDCLQFHGDETAEQCRRFAKPYIKAIRMRAETDLMHIQQDYHDAAALLLDAWHPDANGGTGQAFNWQLIPKHVTAPIILAGGLDADNVAEAITEVNPYAVDVSSGVEAEKGIKDNKKIAAFIRRANQVIKEE